MSTEALVHPDDSITLDMVPGPGGTFWQIVARDERGHPIELRRMHDVAAVRDADGALIGFSVGCHPSRGNVPTDVIFRPQPRQPEPHEDCYRALDDPIGTRMARFYAAHPDGPQTPAEHAEEQALRAGFAKRDRPGTPRPVRVKGDSVVVGLNPSRG